VVVDLEVVDSGEADLAGDFEVGAFEEDLVVLEDHVGLPVELHLGEQELIV
jgi:hypothetical protein